MESADTQTIATFTGTLLQRKRMPGKPFVQLVFREAEKDWLCLSSNLQHVANLQIGKEYHIEGIFKSLGDHRYIHEPDIMPIARQIVKRRVWISIASAVGIILLAGGIVLAASHDPSTPRQNTPPHTSPLPPIADTGSSAPTDTPPDTSNTDTTTPDSPAATPTPVVTPKTVTPAPQSTTPPPSNPAVVTPPAPQPHCDAIVTTTLDPVINKDPDEPTTYEVITQGGIDQQTQTCYPDVGNSSPTVTTIVPGQPEIKTVGTKAPDPDLGS